MNKEKPTWHNKRTWKVVEDDHAIGQFSIKDQDGYWVASTIGGLPDGQERANADLIAASPRLYRALASLVKAANKKELDALEMFACIENAGYALESADGGVA